MKPTLLSVKELAQELGISTDSVYRAYRKGGDSGCANKSDDSVQFREGAPGDGEESERDAEQSAFKAARPAKRPRTVRRGLL